MLTWFIIKVKTEQHKSKTSISFKESIDLTNIPIVTFQCKGNKLHFLLDTGSDDSYLASTAEKYVRCFVNTIVGSNVAGFGGVETIEHKRYYVTLEYKRNTYEVELNVAEHLNDAFAHLKQEYGIQLHGILGSTFFERYKYVLDFKDLIAYQR